MNILFVHRGFPAQFKYLATLLSLEPHNKVLFITADNQAEIEGIHKLTYQVQENFVKSTNPYIVNIENAVMHGQAAAGIALELKKHGFKPDIIYGFSGWGSSLFIKDVYPDVPFLAYLEWFHDLKHEDCDLDGTLLDEEKRGNFRCNNSHVLMTLDACDAGISPTQWQKECFPEEFHNKIEVIHDGIDTKFFQPDDDVKFFIKDPNIELTCKDEVITYGTRGMEPCRGFLEFMGAIKKVLSKRKNAHVVIAGDDIVCYSTKHADETYKEIMMKELDENLERVHFTGKLPPNEYLKLLQISSIHTYLTKPFVLSWSMLEAMSAGCLLVASDVAPVKEIVEDNVNGFLVDHLDINALADKIEYVLENQDKLKNIRENARQKIVEKYDMVKVLPKQIELIENLIGKNI